MKTAERIQLVFGIQATLDLSYTVLEGNSGISKTNGTSLRNFVVTLVFANFATAR